NLTTLSGDIGIENNISDNTYQVVISVDDVGSAKIDGFTITKGNANGASFITINSRELNRNSGGGIYNNSSSPTLTNTNIINNSADNGGGICNISSSSPIITNTNISNNSTNNDGGGIYNLYSSPIITNTNISNNSAYRSGGGNYNFYSSPTLTNTTISNNSAYNGGGGYNYASSPIITNTTISNNSCSFNGGGIYNQFSSPTINNSIIWANTKNSDQSVNNVYNINNSTPVYKYSLIQGSVVNSNWVSSFGTDGGNNIDVNPMFANPTNGDFTLTDVSPAINAGNNSLYGTSIATDTDLAGNPRLFGTTIDMGAYEKQSCPNISAPTANNQEFCIVENKTIADLVVTGQNIKWYETATSTTELATTTVLTSGSYFATQTQNDCESVNRAEVVVTIHNTAAPTAQNQEFCIAENATIANLVATGTDIKWYDSVTSTTALNTNIALVNGTSYFASQTINGCESVNRTEVVITIHNTAAPTAINQAFCISENATIADLVAIGQNIKWYDSETSTTELATTTVLTSGSYFASQTENGCESVNRAEVVVTIQDTAAPTAVDQEFCISENATIADLVATGQNIKWYETATSTTVLNTNIALVNGISYFATQTLNNCESVNRTEVVVTIQDTPAPTAQNQEFCIAGNATIANLVATGQNIKWYDSVSSTTELAITTILTSGSYFASQTLNNCESVNRAEVVVTIQDTAAPTAQNQEFCISENATIANLVATGTDIKWYDSVTSTTALNTNVALVNGTSYFASQTLNNCESVNRTEVVVTIQDTAAPTAINQAFCISENATIADLVATGQNIKWYETATSTTELATTTVLTSGSYFASQTLNNCESVNRTEVMVTIQDTAAPTAQNQEFCIAENAMIANLVATGQNIKWYETATSTTELATTTVLTSGSYFASQTENNCESVNRAEVVVAIQDTAAPTATSIQEFCSNQNSKISDLVITGTNIRWYGSETSTTELNTNTSLVNGASYFATQTENGCESANRTEVQIQISTPPNLPSGDSIQTFCGNATIADLEIVGLPDAELIWYQTSYSNTILPTSTTLANATYYVAQKVGACISDRKPVTARIINLSPPNVGDFEFCGSAVVADLYIPAATGVTYKWYNSPSSTNQLTSTTPLNTGTYFVSKNEYNCETQRTAVSVLIKDLPDSPTGVSPQIFIEGSVLNQIVVNPTTSVYYITEEDARTNTNPLSLNMPLVNGTTYYAVVIGTNGCPSLPLPITVDVYLSNNLSSINKSRKIVGKKKK
ncbi:Ig-like domain-containing protein, partial [Paenimyroides tangerinum]|uniref:Ig-like domain-containing protein n=1 Tax=Paenimyroides tangerinum TaxID=2488728 RepID=UPI00131528B6